MIGWLHFALAIASVRYPAGDRGEGYSNIALVDNLGIPPLTAVNLLKHHGIQASTYGSQLYAVRVSTARAKEARKILIADAIKHPYLYEQIEGYKGKLGLPAKVPWIVRKFNINLSDIERSPVLHSDPNLLGLAREAQRYLGETVHLKKDAVPYIVSMKLFPMEYVDPAGKSESGYLAKVDIRYRFSEATCDCCSYVWDRGKNHASIGGGSVDSF